MTDFSARMRARSPFLLASAGLALALGLLFSGSGPVAAAPLSQDADGVIGSAVTTQADAAGTELGDPVTVQRDPSEAGTPADPDSQYPSSDGELGPPADAPAPDTNAEMAAPNYTGCSTTVPAVVSASYEQEVIERVNQERLNNGNLPPLKRVTNLDSASRNHGVDMAADNYFQHDSYDRDGSGTLVMSCGWSTRISGFYGGWTTLSENIAAGYTTPATAVAGWMASSGHRANILSTSAWEMGAGYNCCGGGYGRYWVQDFGRRSGVYPLIIEREKELASSATVGIYIYGSHTEMRLRTDTGAWSNWQPFTNSFSYTITGGDGPHTVAAELRTGTTVRSTSDSITVTGGGGGTPPTATPIATSLPLPTATPAGTGGGTFTFVAPHDAVVASNYPTYNFGTYPLSLARAGSPIYRSFLKFQVSGLTRPVASAKLRLAVYDGSPSGGTVYLASNTYSGSGTAWSESGLTWNNQPALQGALGTLGAVSAGTWVELAVTGFVPGNGTYSFGLTSASADTVAYYSSEGSTPYQAQLVIQTLP